MKLVEYGKLNALRSLYSVDSIQATLERKLSDIIKIAFLRRWSERVSIYPLVPKIKLAKVA